MLTQIKRNIRFLLGIKNDTNYYAQAGEDAIVAKTFAYVIPVTKGIYVDVGSYHPFRHSNTYLLYKAGWNGINIDPRPGSKALFDKFRPRDINVEAGIASQDGNMTYYMLNEGSTMNSFSKDNLVQLGVFDQVTRKVDVPVYKIGSLLDQYPQIKDIDYLNIDAEGFEMEILSGLDFSSIPPKVISIEQNNVFTFDDVLSSPVCRLLTGKGYTAFAKNVLLSTVSTVFYMRNDCKNQVS